MLEVCIASMEASDWYRKGLRIMLKHYHSGRVEVFA